MNQQIVKILSERFGNQFIIKTDNKTSCILFPAVNDSFGDILIYEQEVGAYVLVLGHFTHYHIDAETDTKEKMVIDAANEMIDMLEKIFSDQIVCHGSHRGGGGWCMLQYVEDEIDHDFDAFVWSGRYKRVKVDDSDNNESM